MRPGVTTRCAVLGDPVEHSLSPVLHRAAYDALGLPDWSYDAVRVPGGTLAGFLDGLDESWRGLSLTMPLKRELLALAGELGWECHPRVHAAGGANTLVRAGGAWRADNTDLPGATAASVGLALCDLGATRVELLVRSVERAEETLATIRRHDSAPEVLAVESADRVSPADVLVSTVPADAQDPALIDRSGAALLFEALYDPWPTPLAAAAQRGGLAVVSGLDLLVHQAVLQVAQMTGSSVPVAVLRDAGERALLERAGRARS